MIADRIVVWLGVIENLDPGLMEASLLLSLLYHCCVWHDPSLPPALPPALPHRRLRLQYYLMWLTFVEGKRLRSLMKHALHEICAPVRPRHGPCHHTAQHHAVSA